MTTDLTARQEAILKAITDSVKTRGFPPTVREIGDLVGLKSASSVVHQLDQLQAAGYLTREADKPRAIRVTTPGEA